MMTRIVCLVFLVSLGSSPAQTPADSATASSPTGAVALKRFPTAKGVVIPKVFSARRGPEREKLLQQYGGSGWTDRPVLAALNWLKKQQKADGTWEANRSEAIAALAVLAFLGYGETSDSKEFGESVDRALAYLVDSVGGDGMVRRREMYSQGIVTLALAEAYGLTQSPDLREPLKKCVDAILLAQQQKKTKPEHVGGWRYSPTSGDSDVSVSGWQIAALKAAQAAGLPILNESTKKAEQYLWNMYDGQGGFGYTSPERSINMTAVGVSCQQFFRKGNDPRVQRSLDFLQKTTDPVDSPWDSKKFSIYGWYYITQAMFQTGGERWTNWNRKLRVLVRNQLPDGHWKAREDSEENGWPTLATSLCCLTLETYYRYPRVP